MRRSLNTALALMLVGAAPPVCADTPRAPQAFHPPEPILDGSQHRQLYPAFADLDGDSKSDLLVGVVSKSGGGRLLIYPNQGTSTHPAYTDSTWLDTTVATARVPDG
jgi:hypothetical protein